METGLAIAIFSGLGAMLSWGSADFFAKLSVGKIGDYTTLFWSQTVGGVLLLILFLFNRDVGSITISDLLILIVLGVIDAISWIYFYKSLEKGEVSIMSPIFASWAGGSVLISYFFFGEQITRNQWILLSLIFLGIILTSLDINNLRRKIYKSVNGITEIIIATVLFSVWVAWWGNFGNGKPWIFYTLLMRIIVIFVLGAVCNHKKIHLSIKGTKIRVLIFMIGVFEVLAYSLVSYGFSITNYVSIVAVLSGAFSVPTILLARFFLKERMSPIQIIGSSVIIFGIVALAVL